MTWKYVDSNILVQKTQQGRDEHTHTHQEYLSHKWFWTLPISHREPGFHFCARHHIHHHFLSHNAGNVSPCWVDECWDSASVDLSFLRCTQTLASPHFPRRVISERHLYGENWWLQETYLYLFMRSITACDMSVSGTSIRKAQTFPWRHEHPPFTTISAAFRPQEKTITPPGLPIEGGNRWGMNHGIICQNSVWYHDRCMRVWWWNEENHHVF